MDLSHSPLLQAISNNAEKFANRVALIEGNSQVSYSELWKKIIDAAPLTSCSTSIQLFYRNSSINN